MFHSSYVLFDAGASDLFPCVARLFTRQAAENAPPAEEDAVEEAEAAETTAAEGPEA